ncbi:MAG: DMT family transporter [Gammaproteobacteria bacterium]|nr:DMT family transporter [Gammaproteobacteria bacterium]
MTTPNHPNAQAPQVFAAYVGVILIWATAPLATKWSGEGPGFLFAVTSRMCLALVCVLLVLVLRRVAFPFNRRAWLHYGAGAISIYFSMSLSYWAAQQIPSGWVSVLFGLTPLMTAFLSRIVLAENSLTPRKLAAQVVSLFGLWIIYGTASALGPRAVLAIGALLVAAFIHSLSAVLIKRVNANVPALASVAGALLLSVPAYLITWWWVEDGCPAQLPLRSVLSIVYLGLVATTVGMSWYFFVLKHYTATRVAMITFMTPVLALLAGYAFNAEPLTWRIVAGAGLILGGLLLHEVGRLRGISPIA